MNFAIAVLSWNSAHFLSSLLQSIWAHTPTPYRLLVVDNGSSDDSVQEAKRRGVEVLELPYNTGVSGGRNAALDYFGKSPPDWLCFLDADTVVPDRWDKRLLEHTRRKGVGVIGAVTGGSSAHHRVSVEPPNGADIPALNAFARSWASSHNGEWFDTEAVWGFCYLIRWGVVARIGGFDTSFGRYGCEDDDFAWRARLAGFKTGVALDTYVHHWGGHGLSQLPPTEAPEAWCRFLAKWHLPADLSHTQYVALKHHHHLNPI